MSKGQIPEPNYDLEIERTFRRRRNSSQQQQEKDPNMAEQLEDRAPNTNHIMVNPILSVNDRNRPIRDYASPDLYDLSPGIMRPTLDGSRFEMKPVMLQMIKIAGQFGSRLGEDPYAHLCMRSESQRQIGKITCL